MTEKKDGVAVIFWKRITHPNGSIGFEILIQIRQDNKRGCLPGGGIDKNERESPLQAAIREIWEENKIVVLPHELTGLGYYDVSDGTKFHLFGNEVDEEFSFEKTSDESSDAYFVLFSDLLNKLKDTQGAPNEVWSVFMAGLVLRDNLNGYTRSAIGPLLGPYKDSWGVTWERPNY